VRACPTRDPAAKAEARSRKAARRPARAPAPKRSSWIGCSARWHKRPPAARQQGKQVPYGWDLQHLRVRPGWRILIRLGRGRSDVPDRGEQYDVRCLMCGTEVGSLAFGRFIKHAGCARPLPRKGGLPRCCHCGGTLYLAPMEATCRPQTTAGLTACRPRRRGVRRVGAGTGERAAAGAVLPNRAEG
jgi:hypothetical protein